jgi:plasmid stabilization system protein ParE
MVRQIRWSLRAEQDRREIEDYWTNRNKSNIYSLKLDLLFREGVKLLSKTPELGSATKFPSVRFKIIRDYLVYYRINSDFIEIITIWDSRRNPKKFRL